MSPRPLYQHTQIGWTTLIGAAAGAAVGLVALHFTPGAPSAAGWVAALIAGVALLTALGFGALRVQVNRESLGWRFGLGWPRKSLRIADIASVQATRTRWIEGWGIHFTKRGWLYNVSGFDAVLVLLRDGKSVLIGTDEPRQLAAAIERARSGR